jgi:hypothetical protein
MPGYQRSMGCVNGRCQRTPVEALIVEIASGNTQELKPIRKNKFSYLKVLTTSASLPVCKENAPELEKHLKGLGFEKVEIFVYKSEEGRRRRYP